MRGYRGLTRVFAAEFGKHGIKSICICSSAIYKSHKILEMISDFSRLSGISTEDMTAQYKRFDLLKSGPTLKQLGETAVFLASENGILFNSHIVDVDCGKLNLL
jgi:3-oxoacyl-[acyl-carrier protein] reductase